MCPDIEFFSGLYFPIFILFSHFPTVFSPKMGKHGPEKTPYLNKFRTVQKKSKVAINTFL